MISSTQNIHDNTEVINMKLIISNFIRDNNDYDMDITTKVRNIISMMNDIFFSSDDIYISLYISEMSLSKDFEQFLSNNSSTIVALINSQSKILDSITLRQFETFYSNYLLKNKNYIEPIQICWIRISYALSSSIQEFEYNYQLLADGYISVSSIIYKRSGTSKPQFISCFLSTPENTIYSILDTFKNLGLASKNGGGVGISLNRLTSSSKVGDLQYIGIGPWIELFSNIINVRMRDFKKGAIAIYLPFYHKDIYTFLKSIDDEHSSNKNTLMNKLGVYVNNIFLDAVLTNSDIYLFNPADYPEISDMYCDDFGDIYFSKIKYDPNSITISARELLSRIAKSIINFGGPYILNLDAMNLMCNQRMHGMVVSNLCTEMTEVADKGNIACCNLSQLPLHNFYINKVFRFDLLASSTRQVVRNLNRLIDTTYYPIHEELERHDSNRSLSSKSPDKDFNLETRPLGIGISGLFTLFSMMRINYSDEDSLKHFEILTSKIMSCIYFNAIFESCKMSMERNDGGIKTNELFQFDLRDEYRDYIQNSKYLSDEFKSTSANYDQSIPIAEPSQWGQAPLILDNGDEIYEVENYNDLRYVCSKFGRLNSLLTSLMPTITNSITSAGSQAFDPEYSNLFNNASGNNQILSINKYLKKDLISIGWYTPEVINYIKINGGSVKGLSKFITDNNLVIKNLDYLNVIENTYWTSHEIPHDYHMRIIHILSHYIDQSCSYNMYIENFEDDLCKNIMKRGMMSFKTILYYARLKTKSKSIKHSQNICIECVS